MRRLILALALGALASACGEGEVTTLVLPVVPDNGEQFGVAQQAMIAVGCGLAGCHSAIVGNFKVTGEPGARDDEYLLTKAAIDLENPEDSRLLRVALAGDPAAVGHPICYAGPTGCAWQILSAWIRGGTFEEDQAGNPLQPPSMIAAGCMPTPNACFTGGD